MLDWEKCSEVAERFQYKAKFEDRGDLRHNIIIRLAEVAQRNGHKPFTEGAMVRVASYVVMEYWRGVMRLPRITSLDETIYDGDGNETELYQMLADDKAIDVDAWLDAKLWLYRAPPRLVKIAYKKVSGLPLTDRDRNYLYQQRKKAQKSLAFI